MLDISFWCMSSSKFGLMQFGKNERLFVFGNNTYLCDRTFISACLKMISCPSCLSLFANPRR